MLGAFFMATDYVTSPITPMGQIIFGICCGILTGLFRCFGANAEGVSFAIILSNILVPLIEKHSCDNYCVSSEAFQLTGYQVLGDDTACTTVNQYYVGAAG